jgi:2-C-methyl-D-erythritol 4-phosphate cytidylyltransferase
MTKKISAPRQIAVRGFTIHEAIARAKEKHDAYEATLAAMPPAEAAAKRAADEAEVEAILRQLRGPGFMELKL